MHHTSLTVGEIVRVLNGSGAHAKWRDSFLLGAESEFFWIFSPDLRMVYRGHPDAIAEEEGNKE